MELLERCMADASLLTHVAVSKYADHIPLHRLEVIFRRMGIDISRWTMCNWVTRMGDQLSVLADEMLRLVRQSRHTHVDETTLPVLAPGKTKTSYVWSVVGGKDAPYTLYRFTTGRGRAGPLEFLAGFKGVLQTDAYVVYENLTRSMKLTWAACWAHVRRKFVDAFKLSACADARHAIDDIRQLYAIERTAQSMSDEQRCALRQEKAVPLIDSFFKWLEERQFKVLPLSPMGKAVTYALNLRAQLRVYLDHGFVGIDNNPVERALRPVVVGRKNWMFAGNEAGGRAAAVFYSLIESAKRHSLNVADYLEDVIRRLPSHPKSRIHELLPDQWQPLTSVAR
jgi:transposase